MYKQSGLMQFNIQPILDDIDNVIKNGLSKLLDKQLNRYELLEKTHTAIMNLPSVVNDINSLPIPKTHNMTDTILLNKLSELNESFQSMCDRLTSKINKIDDKFKEYDKKFDLLSDELLTLKNNTNLLPSVVNEETQHNINDTILTELTESFQKLCDTLTVKMDEVSSKLKKHEDKFDLLSDELLTLKNNMVVETHPYQYIKIEEDFESKEPENIILEMKEDNKIITFHIDECEKEKEVVKVLKRKLIIESNEDEVDLTDESSFWPEYKSTTTSNTNTNIENNEEMKLDELDEILEIEKEKIEQRAQIQEEEEARAHEEEEGANDEGKKEDLNEVEIEEEVETEKSESESEKEEEEEDIFEIDIDDVTYCTNNETTGFIYELTDGEMGDKVGYFKDGEPFFYADEK